ncbi:hypothetical protein RhiirC2_716771 [Rhizophagus irregularis]|uniref:DNA-directed DNA polymerase n=1 Tax=Rhizophagus irregularis TaxID=588596 RepID=A0A2N1MQ32_9GLOM|nr:hypothetical protein RhiirC2_716771 [Rhizophagus irregularis]
MAYSKIARALPTRLDIKELQYLGARFSRGAIAKLGQRFQFQYPIHKFQILLLYENWKPGKWTSGNESASLFSLLDHYDESQLPDDADPDYFERFIIYMRDAPPTAGGCNRKLNDCLYEYLKHIYGTFSKILKTIKKSEYIKKVLGLNRNAPVPVSYMDKVEQLAGSLALNIVGDSTRISKSKSDRCATLILSEGHYSLALNPRRLHPSKLDRKQKSPFVYREDGVNNVVTIYNGKTVKSLTVGQFQKVKAKWISDVMLIIWANNEWQDYGRQYDVTSLYPSIQQLNANFPIRRGKFQTLSDFVDHRGYALYGLFHAKNKRGIYIFINLQRAKKLGLNIQLIQDRKPNTLIYDREARILGTVIFRSDQWRFQFTNPGNPFKGEYPRIAPFLLAYGRKTTSELLKPYKDKVQRIHTDGFILKEQPDSSALITCPENASKALKALKFETAGYCHVKNANKVIWT